MKTSNKLLISLVVLALIFPVIIAFSFKKSVEEKKFIVKSYLTDNNTKFNKVPPFKVIKIISTDLTTNPLECNIKRGENFGYTHLYDKYANDKIDSSAVRILGDTLVIKYTPRKSHNKDEEYQPANFIDVVMPAIDGIIAEGAIVNMDVADLPRMDSVHINLNGNSNLNIGYIRRAEPAQESITSVKNMFIESHNASTNFYGNFIIHNLQANILGTSKLDIANKVQVNNISGSASDSSTINASTMLIKKLLGNDTFVKMK